MDTLKKTFTWGEPKFCQKVSVAYMKRCTVGDINSFFMLFFDNFSSLLAILAEMIFITKIVTEFKPMSMPVGVGAYSTATVQDYYDANAFNVWAKVCPGIAVALLVGNLWYAWMAWKLAGKEGRMDVTALPYGINTPAGFLTVFMVQLSIMFHPLVNPRASAISPTDFADNAWKGACAANFIGGLFEVSGIWLGGIMRENIPRAALFAPVCGVGFVWLGYNPLIDVMREPIVGMIPLFLTFSSFFAQGGKGIYSNKLPMALIMMLVGTILWWCGLARHDTEKRELNEPPAMGLLVDEAWAKYVGKNSMQPFSCLGFNMMESKFVAIAFPIALASFIETIENVEMAALKGDSYNVKEAMLADGLGTMLGACFGSVIPTTVYIGHVRHKAAGAGWLYSVLNAIAFFVLLMSGLMAPLFYAIDPYSVGCILIAVGLMIVQSAMEASASRHYPCLMIGIMFLVSDMLYFDHFDETVRVATRSIGRMKGVMNMAPGGGIMCSLVVTAFLCDVIDSRYGRASFWAFFAACLSFIGAMHGANYIYPDGRMITVMGTDDADYWTTDLGEITLSLPVTATHAQFQFSRETGELDAYGFITPYAWSYAINEGAKGFQDIFRCPPWERDWGHASGAAPPKCMTCGDFPEKFEGADALGIPRGWGWAGQDPAHTTVASDFTFGGTTYGKQPAFDAHAKVQKTPYNEGWRFAVAYLMLFIICLVHYVVIKFKGEAWGIEVVMDNGYAPGTGPTEEEPAKKVETASV